MFLPVFTAAVSAITTAVATLGPAVSSFVASIGPTLAAITQQLKPYAEALASFANNLLQSLGVLQPGELISDLGERALQGLSEGIRLDSYSSVSDYLAAIRKIDIAPDISDERSFAEKLISGIGIGTLALEDKFNIEKGGLNGIWLLPLANPKYFTAERMEYLITSVQLGDNVLGYLNKALTGGDARSFEKALEKNEQGSQITTDARVDLYDALEAAQDKWADINNQIKGNEG